MSIRFISTTALLGPLMAAVLLFSCESHATEKPSAFEEEKQERMANGESDSMAPDAKLATPKASKGKNVTTQDPWTRFEKDIDQKVQSNEVLIKRLRSNQSNGKTLKKITSLEKENNDLRLRLDAYRKESDARWEKFKAEITTGAEAIALELHDLDAKVK